MPKIIQHATILHLTLKNIWIRRDLSNILWSDFGGLKVFFRQKNYIQKYIQLIKNKVEHIILIHYL